MRYFLWLDDDIEYRDPQQQKPGYYEPITWAKYHFNPHNPKPEEIVWAYNFDHFVEVIKEKGMPVMISFDHHLTGGMTGMDCAKWLIAYCEDNNLELPEWDVHSSDSFAVVNINKLLENFKKSQTVKF